MDQSAKKTLCRQLGTVDSSIFFLLLIILATLLSFWSILIQRGQLVCTIEGNPEAAAAAPPVYPIRHAASALIVGSLGFFLCLALRTAKEAEAGTDCVAKRSASSNVWASLFVLVAAILRLLDLDFVECRRPAAPGTEAQALETEETELLPGA